VTQQTIDTVSVGADAARLLEMQCQTGTGTTGRGPTAVADRFPAGSDDDGDIRLL